MVTIGKNYFDVLGARVSRGRVFAEGDGTRGRGVAIVNERFAEVHFRRLGRYRAAAAILG